MGRTAFYLMGKYEMFLQRRKDVFDKLPEKHSLSKIGLYMREKQLPEVVKISLFSMEQVLWGVYRKYLLNFFNKVLRLCGISKIM